MRLLITTPTAIIADLPDVAALTAEDASGRFGILDGHAAFLTALSPSVVSWRHEDDREGFCAVRGGVLTVEGGQQVSIATREAVMSGDISRLEQDVVAHYQRSSEEERTARVEAAVLRMKAIRRLIRYLKAPGTRDIGSRP